MTANRSEACDKVLVEAGGQEILVIGLLEGEGISCWDLKVRQYVCSGVSGEGPGGSLTGCSGSTGAAIVFQLPNTRQRAILNRSLSMKYSQNPNAKDFHLQGGISSASRLPYAGGTLALSQDHIRH